MGKLKYNQKVYAKITRIYDEANDEYHFVRNDTKIIFGSGKNFLGTVIMTNPGSFDFKHDPSWEGFKNGEGHNDVFESAIGTADSTMINIIKAVEGAYSLKNSKVPGGYVRIYNLSSIRCPKGDEALEKHNKAKKLLLNRGAEISILEDPVIYDEKCFEEICDQSTFVILGFLKNVLTNEIFRVTKWVDRHSKNKKVIAPDANGHPYHPILWIKLKGSEPFNNVVNTLSKII